MAVSCECGGDYDYDYDYAFRFEASDGYEILNTSKRKRCVNCKTLINVGDLVLRLHRYRFARTDIEDRIYGDSEIALAPWFYCERCADLYLSIVAAGFCVTLDDNTLEENLKDRLAAQKISAMLYKKLSMENV